MLTSIRGATASMNGTIIATYRDGQGDVSHETRNIALAKDRDAKHGRAMPIPVERREAILQFMRRRGLQQTDWCRRAGVPESTLRSFLDPNRKKPVQSMRQATLEKLAAAEGVTISEMLNEEASSPRRAPRDRVAIQQIEIRASAGGGFIVAEETEIVPLYFPRQMIDTLPESNPEHLRAIRVTGQSMLPTLDDGDIAIVALQSDIVQFEPGAIYALWDGNGLVVKRLEYMIGEDRPKLRVLSDNGRLFQPYEVDAEQIRIVGRVVWRGGAV